jgi:Flagellar hook-length control protein FliK
MYTGDLSARLQASESGVSPVTALTAIGSDPRYTGDTTGARILARVDAKLAGGLYQVQAGADTLKMALPADTQPGQMLQLRQAPNGRWLVADTASEANAAALLNGRVGGKLADGSFSVQVGIRTMQLALPPQTRAGEQVQLQQLPGGRWVLAGAAASGAPSAPSTHTDVSQAARLVDLVRQAAPGEIPASAHSFMLLPAEPVAEAANQTLPLTLMRALAGALNDSGLFYESHLEQWNAGQRPLASLQREPQAQLQLELDGLPPPSGANTAANTAADAPGAAMAQAGATASNASATSASLLEAGVHPDTLPLISQQLATLENGRLIWNGEMWPGQSLRWQVEREAGDSAYAGNGDGGGASATGREPVWRTRLSLDFPQLGALDASITLQGNTLSARIHAADPAARAQLAAASATLAGALTSAGLSLQALAINQGDHAAAA